MSLLEEIGRSAFSTKETFLNSFECGQYVSDQKIPGAIVECGIAGGSQLAAMILGCESRGCTHRLAYGFDSFEGIELAGPKDWAQPGLDGPHNNPPFDGEIKSSGITAISLEDVESNFRKWNIPNVILVKGWVQHTLFYYESLIAEHGIAVLRLDMDVYEPTKHALKHLYPLVSPGGVIIIDDWVLDGCQTACLEYFEENNITPVLHDIPNSGPKYFFKL